MDNNKIHVRIIPGYRSNCYKRYKEHLESRNKKYFEGLNKIKELAVQLSQEKNSEKIKDLKHRINQIEISTLIEITDLEADLVSDKISEHLKNEYFIHQNMGDIEKYLKDNPICNVIFFFDYNFLSDDGRKEKKYRVKFEKLPYCDCPGFREVSVNVYEGTPDGWSQSPCYRTSYYNNDIFNAFDEIYDFCMREMYKLEESESEREKMIHSFRCSCNPHKEWMETSKG